MEHESGNLSIPEKINARMNTLEMQMNTNMHLSDQRVVLSTIYSITKFWSVLTEEQRDYVESAQFAVEYNKPWNESTTLSD